MNQNLENYNPIMTKPPKHNFKAGDVLVLFGELFNRGYANGLVTEAEKNGLLIVRATVGRRDENNDLRALTDEESANIPKPFINIPLEAGFDLEKNSDGLTPNDLLKGLKLSAWNSANIPIDFMNAAKKSARERFENNTKKFILELEKIISNQIQSGGHIHFAHLMAGGVPRTKIVMPLMNRVFKGTQDRYLASETFMNSSIGQYMLQNFNEVTAETLNILIQQTADLRKKIASHKGSVSYVAYGYHGTAIVINNEYRWQSYAPYIQGWAKIELENYAKKWSKENVNVCVYNCPEILTNSSSIFKGVEIAVYNLMRALEKEIPQHPLTLKLKSECENVLNHKTDLQKIFSMIDDFIIFSEKMGTSDYKNWPQHSKPDQLAATLNLSDAVIALHKDENNLMTSVLSEVIFKSCGYIMLHDGFQPKNPVVWIGHDAVVKCIE